LTHLNEFYWKKKNILNPVPIYGAVLKSHTHSLAEVWSSCLLSYLKESSFHFIAHLFSPHFPNRSSVQLHFHYSLVRISAHFVNKQVGHLTTAREWPLHCMRSLWLLLSFIFSCSNNKTVTT
jgi:hypothetical protein